MDLKKGHFRNQKNFIDFMGQTNQAQCILIVMLEDNFHLLNGHAHFRLCPIGQSHAILWNLLHLRMRTSQETVTLKPILSSLRENNKVRGKVPRFDKIQEETSLPPQYGAQLSRAQVVVFFASSLLLACNPPTHTHLSPSTNESAESERDVHISKWLSSNINARVKGTFNVSILITVTSYN